MLKIFKSKKERLTSAAAKKKLTSLANTSETCGMKTKASKTNRLLCESFIVRITDEKGEYIDYFDCVFTLSTLTGDITVIESDGNVVLVTNLFKIAQEYKNAINEKIGVPNSNTKELNVKIALLNHLYRHYAPMFTSIELDDAFNRRYEYAPN